MSHLSQTCGCDPLLGIRCATHPTVNLWVSPPQFDVDGGQSGLAREVSEPANTREQALITSLERLIEQWREREKKLCRLADTAESAGNSLYARALSGQAQRIADQTDELEAVLSSLTREREP